MKRVVCYCRVSTEEEKQLNALQKQIDELELFVNDKIDWELIDTYVDEGRSGTTIKGRLSYQKLYADLLTDRFDIVLIKDQSRLMRNVLDWYQFLDRLMKSEKQLYLYLDNCFYTPDNKFITGIKAMMAEEYSRDLSKKITSAALRSQKNGTVYGNSRTLGYKQNGGKFEIVPEEAKLVQQIFEWYSQGLGVMKILAKLKEMGIKSGNGTDFSMSTLRRLLKNEKYKGLLISHKTSYNFETKRQVYNPIEDCIVIPNGVPAIVSEELWDKCAKIRESRVEKYKLSNNNKFSNQEYYERYMGKYPLSGKLICMKCGEVMCHDTSRTQSSFKGNVGRDVSKWDCRTYKKMSKDVSKGGCENTRIYNVEIMACIKQIIFDITNGEIKESINRVLDALSVSLENSNNTKQIKSLETQISNIKNKLNKLLDMLLDETIDKVTYNIKKEELDLKLQQLTGQLTELNHQEQNVMSKEARLKNIENFLNTIFECPQNITDEMVAEIVHHINVSRDNSSIVAEMYFSLNNNPKGNNPYIKIYETTYPFTKQGCRLTMEDWKIVAYIN